MHEHHGAGAESVSPGGPQLYFSISKVQWFNELTMRGDAFAYLDHIGVQNRGALDAQCKQLGAVLIADLDGVAKSCGGDQQRPFSLAFQQGIGCHRRAQFDDLDLIYGDRLPGLQSQQIANSLDGRVRVPLGVLGQQLVREQLAVRAERYDVGERSAAINPELPLR